MMKILSILLVAASTLFSPDASFNARGKSHHVHGLYLNAQESDIKIIRDEYARINKLKLKAEKHKYETKDCVEGGEITYYTLGNQVLKVTEKGAMDDTIWNKEYYYRNGKIFFCLESLQWGPAAGPTVTTAYRFYIKDGKPIREMEDKKIVGLHEKASETILTANKILKVRATKDFASVYCM